MRPVHGEGATGEASASGEHERRLAVGYFTRQASQVIGVLTGLGVTTVLARRLPLSEFGTYALLLSVTSYLIVIQAVVETSAIKTIAEASDQRARDRAFSTAALVYAATGIVAGALVAGLGALLLQIWSVPPTLRHEARLGVVALAVVTSISWPTRVFYDTLRASQLFTFAAGAEIAALIISGSLVITFVLVGAPLWLVVSATAAGSFATGASSALFIYLKRLPYRFRRDLVSRRETQSFLALSGYFFLAGLSDFVIYSLDRTILGAFRSAATVGLYEGPVRAHNLVRDVQATLVGPVLPAAVRYRTEGDIERMRELLVRGTRYTVAVIAPLALVLAVLARPILEAWLGSKFDAAVPAMSILVGYWIIYANTAVGWNMLVAIGQVRKFALFAAGVAILNVALSVALTPSLGLNGVVLGTTIPYLLGLPVFLRIALPEFGVGLGEFARQVWLPAYSTACVIGAGLATLRFTVDLATIPASAAAAVAALFAYWSVYYVVWLKPNERLLLHNLARQFARR
ncbi:MAG: oligosaccharide flippase family protein [Actinomycetota bacterium]|nr:oligosaccharide flippase family protein [Actinomycetota bacterium]